MGIKREGSRARIVGGAQSRLYVRLARGGGGGVAAGGAAGCSAERTVAVRPPRDATSRAAPPRAYRAS